MYLVIITLPLLASIASGFFGRKIGVIGSQVITNSAILLTTLLSVAIFFEVGFNNTPIHLELFKWIDSETLKVYWGFNFDSLTASMLIPVLIVSCLVHMYSIGYMSHDPHNQRFFSYLSLFTFMMIILVTADNYLLMFVGWEGVGICSYLLVSFWFTRIAANQSSISAFLTNRVGDCLLTIGIFIMIWSFGNVDYTTVFSLSPFINENIVTMVGACLLIGAMAKSSQIGLHVWLPQAMEGPTPVSALIHAATMVTAGVYLLMRSSPLIEYSSTILMLCVWIGAFTTVFSSLIGLFQQDIKKVIAYSTMSQLGLMVVAVGLSCYNIALFHLVNHAFYKALLFLGAGSVIHAMSDNQDFRKYGSLRSYLPLTYSAMFIASLSLVAFPFMTGFYSKDFILESAYSLFGYAGVAIYIISTIGAVFTTLYSFKVLYLTFLTAPNATKIDYHNAKENDAMMSTPLIILSIFSIFFGFITKDMFVGLGSDFYADNGIFVHPKHEITINTEFAIPTVVKLLPFFFTLTFIFFSLYISEFSYRSLINFKYTKFGYNVFSFFNQRFYIELFYNKYITDNILNLGGQTTKIIDKGSVEMVGPYGLQLILQFISKTISRLDTGIVTSYALYILLGLVFYILTRYTIHHINALIVVFCLTLLTRELFVNRISNSHQGFININLRNSVFDWYFILKLIKLIKYLSLILFLGVLLFFSFPFIPKLILGLLGVQDSNPMLHALIISYISGISVVLLNILTACFFNKNINKKNITFKFFFSVILTFFLIYTGLHYILIEYFFKDYIYTDTMNIKKIFSNALNNIALLLDVIVNIKWIVEKFGFHTMNMGPSDLPAKSNILSNITNSMDRGNTRGNNPNNVPINRGDSPNIPFNRGASSNFNNRGPFIRTNPFASLPNGPYISPYGVPLGARVEDLQNGTSKITMNSHRKTHSRVYNNGDSESVYREFWFFQRFDAELILMRRARNQGYPPAYAEARISSLWSSGFDTETRDRIFRDLDPEAQSVIEDMRRRQQDSRGRR